MQNRKGKKEPYPLALSDKGAAYLAGEVLVKVEKLGEPPKRTVVEGPLRADKDKAARCCVDWAIKQYGEDGKGGKGQ